MTRDDHDGAWVEALLRAARPGALDDGRFSAAVLARIAAAAPGLPPAAALAALRRAERRERRYARWTIGGTVAGIAVAAGVIYLGHTSDVAEAQSLAVSLLALFAVSCSLAWLALSAGWERAVW